MVEEIDWNCPEIAQEGWTEAPQVRMTVRWRYQVQTAHVPGPPFSISPWIAGSEALPVRRVADKKEFVDVPGFRIVT